MNEDRDELFEEFKAEWPEMFANVECGFYLPKGWEHIVWSLCEMIDWESRLNTNEDMEPVRVSQVKSKFGGLRFYCEGGNEAIECFVVATEHLSYKICGNCGKTDKQIIPQEHTLNCLRKE